MSSDKSFFSLEELKQINNTIDNIYNVMLSEKSLSDFMSDFLENIEKQIFFDKGNFILIDYHPQIESYEINTFAPLGWKDLDIDRYISEVFKVDDVIPILMRKESIAFRNDDIFSLKERRKTPYYQKFVEPSLIQTSIDANIILPETINTKLIMGFFRDPGKKGFSDKELELIKLYQPHLSKVFAKYFKNGDLSLYQMVSVLEMFDSFGVCVLDAEGKILSINSEFKHIILNETYSSITDNALTQQIRKLCTLITSTQAKKTGPVVFNTVSTSYNIDVGMFSDDSLKDRFIAIVYSCSDFFLQRFSKIRDEHKLTSREFEVLLLMIGKGMSTEELAAALFISTSTVKKHVFSAYQKMGINSQKQLIALLELI